MAEQSWRGGFSRLEQPAGSAGKKAIELPHREQQQQQQDERRAEVPWTVLEESSLSERASEREGRTEMELAGRTSEGCRRGSKGPGSTVSAAGGASWVKPDGRTQRGRRQLTS